MSIDHYTYRVTWSPEDNEYLGLCAEYPSLSWLADAPDSALAGIRRVVADVVADLRAGGEPVPEPMAEKRYSGEFRVRIPPDLHRRLAFTRRRARGEPESAGKREIGGMRRWSYWTVFPSRSLGTSATSAMNLLMPDPCRNPAAAD